MKNIKAWAVVNWKKSAIVNDGEGQKKIYRLKEFAELEAISLGYGTSVVPIIITPLLKKSLSKIK